MKTTIPRPTRAAPLAAAAAAATLLAGCGGSDDAAQMSCSEFMNIKVQSVDTVIQTAERIGWMEKLSDLPAFERYPPFE